MKKIFGFIFLLLVHATLFAQQDSVKIVNNVRIPIKTQLSALFSHLNLKEVSSGFLEEKSYTPLTPSYFKGEGVLYHKPSTKDVWNWQKTLKTFVLVLSNDKKSYPDVQKTIASMDSL
jgi:hypothetical protein